MGGVHGDAAHHAHSPENLLALCRPCHDFTEDQPLQARALGWLVPHAYDPATTPALLVPIFGKEWWMLLEDASYMRASEATVRDFLRRVDTDSV